VPLFIVDSSRDISCFSFLSRHLLEPYRPPGGLSESLYLELLTLVAGYLAKRLEIALRRRLFTQLGGLQVRRGGLVSGTGVRPKTERERALAWRSKVPLHLDLSSTVFPGPVASLSGQGKAGARRSTFWPSNLRPGELSSARAL